MNKIIFIIASVLIVMTLTSCGKSDKSVGIIGGADGPTAVFVTGSDK